MAISRSDALSVKVTPMTPTIETQSVKCESCAFTEECTPTYILRLRERYQGRWICGLCVEAVKVEVLRSDSLISTEEALDRHIRFCKKFRSSIPPDNIEHPINAMSRILRRSLDSPRPVRSNSGSVLPGLERVETTSLVRSESCFSALSR